MATTEHIAVLFIVCKGHGKSRTLSSSGSLGGGLVNGSLKSVLFAEMFRVRYKTRAARICSRTATLRLPRLTSICFHCRKRGLT